MKEDHVNFLDCPYLHNQLKALDYTLYMLILIQYKIYL